MSLACGLGVPTSLPCVLGILWHVDPLALGDLELSEDLFIVIIAKIVGVVELVVGLGPDELL